MIDPLSVQNAKVSDLVKLQGMANEKIATARAYAKANNHSMMPSDLGLWVDILLMCQSELKRRGL